MSKVKIELNSAGVRDMLRSPEMQALLEERAQNVLNSLGAGYDKSLMVGKNRANVSIIVTTYDAYRDNLSNNTILKALR